MDITLRSSEDELIIEVKDDYIYFSIVTSDNEQIDFRMTDEEWVVFQSSINQWLLLKKNK